MFAAYVCLTFYIIHRKFMQWRAYTICLISSKYEKDAKNEMHFLLTYTSSPCYIFCFLCFSNALTHPVTNCIQGK